MRTCQTCSRKHPQHPDPNRPRLYPATYLTSVTIGIAALALGLRILEILQAAHPLGTMAP